MKLQHFQILKTLPPNQFFKIAIDLVNFVADLGMIWGGK